MHGPLSIKTRHVTSRHTYIYVHLGYLRYRDCRRL